MTALQQAILDYIRQHPGLTAEEVAAGAFEDAISYRQTMEAVYYLYFYLHISRDPVTGALTANQEA